MHLAPTSSDHSSSSSGMLGNRDHIFQQFRLRNPFSEYINSLNPRLFRQRFIGGERRGPDNASVSIGSLTQPYSKWQLTG